jgi:lysylphosphatidylglycerol synthetase-like protein (DUF2156 family)
VIGRPGRTLTPTGEADFVLVRQLVAGSEGDPLAPFALRPEKSYVFAPGGLGAGERARPLWTQYRFSGIPIGRDVVVRGADFTLRGRRFRNLRQAVQRSHNAGVTVQFAREGEGAAFALLLLEFSS